LELSIIDKDFKPLNLLSGMLMLVLSRDNNPSGNKMRVGNIDYDRNVHKGFFDNWWLALQSGIKSTTVPNVLLRKKLDSEVISADD